MKRFWITAALAAPLVLAGLCPAAYAQREPPNENPSQATVTATVNITTPANDSTSQNVMQITDDLVSVTCASSHEIKVVGMSAYSLFTLIWDFGGADGSEENNGAGGSALTDAMGEWKKNRSYSGPRNFHPGWNYVSASSYISTSHGSASATKTHRFPVEVP